MKFRKKPVVVEAEQWFPGKNVPGVFLHNPFSGEPYYAVITIHYEVTRIAPGDWIIMEPDGQHYYPCKPDIFAATYEPVL